MTALARLLAAAKAYREAHAPGTFKSGSALMLATQMASEELDAAARDPELDEVNIDSVERRLRELGDALRARGDAHNGHEAEMIANALCTFPELVLPKP